MQNETFRRIVSVKTYEFEVKQITKVAQILKAENRPDIVEES